MTVTLIDDQSRPLDTAALVELAELVLADQGFDGSTLVDITAVDEAAIAELNLTHLERSGPTDVLSFPLEQLLPGDVPAAGAGPLHLGDVVIAPDYIARQALELGVSFEAELALMVVHGMLHLMGFDHTVDDEAEVMEERERVLLAKVGLERR